jgi:hypothetical protein
MQQILSNRLNKSLLPVENSRPQPSAANPKRTSTSLIDDSLTEARDVNQSDISYQLVEIGVIRAQPLLHPSMLIHLGSVA